MSSSSSKALLKLGSSVKKIDSPLAKYNSIGQLSCVLCNTIVKSEMVWTAHVNGRQHRDKVTQLKKPKPSESQFTRPPDVSAIKRKAETGCGPSPKKGVPSDFFDVSPAPIKSILKNATKPISSHQAPIKPVSSPQISTLQVPSKPTATLQIPLKSDINQIVPNQKSNETGSLPEGFFDDPKLDAKVRQIEYKDPVEEEWDKFQKEIHDEAIVSAAIQEEDQEESTVGRQLEEIEDQMLNLGRVLQLDQKKKIISQQMKEIRDSVQMEESSSSSDDEIDEERFFDWRSKAT